ncbi:MAG: peptidoglycan DD-metalloendopeptidase family protein [Candidatus Kaiserbacteria bacterium]|nr:peptidoglycan DD-metalloendopeptidase family protein [Candidatus Kaiserbacteria bacterium]
MKHIGLFIFFVCIVLGVPRFAYADAASDIQSKIEANNRQLDSLKADIAAFQDQLNALGTKKNTLQSTISSLTLSQKQLATQIQVTQNKIASANLQIQQLTLSIGNKETSIIENQDAISKALRSIAENEQTPLITELISSDSLGEAWQETDKAIQFNRALSNNIDNLRTVRTVLTIDRDAVTAAKTQLISLKNDLTLQKRSVDASKTAQQKLLSDTKNQESSYQKLIAQKKAAEKSFEQELSDLQGQLNLIVHPGLLPKVGSGVLTWPFSAAFMFNCSQRKSTFGNLFCISQYFGTTPFATANPQVYNSGGHPGIDVAAPIGTPIYASRGGTILATGNTDLVKGCYSYGKWVMIKHNNGISTLYAHLSNIDVGKGQQVSVGQIIGLSGMTGYATGPHLHYGVYASEGTEIMTLKQFRGASTGCANATMPVATLTAYLNPLSYL